MDIKANLDAYLGRRSPTDRYASFDYCFNYFQSHAEQGRASMLAEGATLESSCLHLGFYLASWGMYRGSALRLQRSLAYLVPAVRMIAAAPREIWSADVNDYSENVSSLIFETCDRIWKAFPEGASETLVTKVMLGVFGCVPAFDSYFKSGFGVWRFDRSALGRIAQFYDENAQVIDEHRVRTLDFGTGSDTDRLYSRAKVVDMIFFIEGARLATTGTSAASSRT